MPRPRSVSRSGETVITNGELARIFNEIGDMLEILGEVVYKAVAYRRVADIVERYPDDPDIASLYAEAVNAAGQGSLLHQLYTDGVGHCPTMMLFKGESHMSEVFSIGSSDKTVSGPILAWINSHK
jgi:hypothetical protein